MFKKLALVAVMVLAPFMGMSKADASFTGCSLNRYPQWQEGQYVCTQHVGTLFTVYRVRIQCIQGAFTYYRSGPWVTLGMNSNQVCVYPDVLVAGSGGVQGQQQ